MEECCLMLELILPATPYMKQIIRKALLHQMLIFSYLQLGVPLKKNWGLVFGLRPLTTINYKIDRNERLYDPNTGSMIDSARTRFSGEGGSFLFNTGTGFAVWNFSVGINAGLFVWQKRLRHPQGIY